MDRYAENMLYDDISEKEDYEMTCPSCQQLLKIKRSDAYVKCMNCGEIFYLESLE